MTTQNRFTISLFKNKTDNIPREIREDWAQIIKRVSNPATRASKDGPLLSPATFKPAHRNKDNAVELSLLMLDFDGEATIDKVEKVLRKLGTQACIYTTYSHQRVTPEHPTVQDCFRVVIALAKPISAKDHSRLWHWANNLFKGKVDANCKDASRMYYLPAIANKGAPFVFRNYVGAPLDWAALDLPEEPKQDLGADDEESDLTLSADAADVADVPDAYFEAAIDGEIEKVENAPLHHRNNTYNKAVWNLARLDIDRATVEDALKPVAERIGLNKKEIQATFDSAFSAGQKNPRVIQSRGPMQTPQKTQAKKSGNGAGAPSGTQAKQTGQASNGSGTQSANTSSQTAQGKQGSGQKKKAPARRRKVDLLELIQKRATLFHDPEGRQYASIKVNSHIETRAIRSEAFALLVCGAYFDETGAGVQSEEFSKTIKTIQAIAQFQGAEKRVHLRVAEQDGKIYVDLCNAQWNVVEITPDAWRVIEAAKAPVLFTRRGGMLPLPEPVQGGDLAELRYLINCEQSVDDDSWALSSAWLAMFFHARGPYPILSVGGEQGSGKSTTCRIFQRLVDPNGGDLRGIPKEERDLMIAANNCRLLAYDNLSGISQEISDRLCRISTGAGFGTRTLHTNDEETIFAARRPILVNGIADIPYSDFQDRNVAIYQRAIPDDQRRDEKKLWEDFMTARPRILGALLSSVSHALKKSATVKLDRKPRMADFALWAVAAESGLGLSEGAFMKAYEDNRKAAHEVALDTSPAIEIREFIDSLTAAEWEGRASDLLKELNAILARKNEDPKTKHGWPQTSTRMSIDLRRVTPNLRSVGIDVEGARTNGKRLIKIRKKP